VPTLIPHGDDDQIVPIDASAKLSAKLVKNAALKIWARRTACARRSRIGSTPTSWSSRADLVGAPGSPPRCRCRARQNCSNAEHAKQRDQSVSHSSAELATLAGLTSASESSGEVITSQGPSRLIQRTRGRPDTTFALL